MSLISLLSDISERILRLLSMGSPALKSADSSVVNVRRSPFDDLRVSLLFMLSLGAATFSGMIPVFFNLSMAVFSSTASMTPSTIAPSSVVALYEKIANYVSCVTLSISLRVVTPVFTFFAPSSSRVFMPCLLAISLI